MPARLGYVRLESATQEERDERQNGESSKIDVLLKTEQTFPPPPEFAAAGERLRSRRSTSAPNADPEAWWGSWAEKLDWIEPFDEILDWSDPPFAKWFSGGKLNVSANCLDRHVDAGNGDRVAFYWEGEDGTNARRSPTPGCSSRPSGSPTG